MLLHGPSDLGREVLLQWITYRDSLTRLKREDSGIAGQSNDNDLLLDGPCAKKFKGIV
jgi:hypothetical protein